MLFKKGAQSTNLFKKGYHDVSLGVKGALGVIDHPMTGAILPLVSPQLAVGYGIAKASGVLQKLKR